MNSQQIATRDRVILLRRQINIVKFGRALLEKKKDALLRAIEEDKKAFSEKERRLKGLVLKLSYSYALVRMYEGPSVVRLLSLGKPKLELKSIVHTLMGCKYLQYQCQKVKNLRLEEVALDPALTSFYIDDLLQTLADIEPVLWDFINIKTKLNSLEMELKKTMMKVNTLDHVVLPKLQTNLSYILNILSERERQERYIAKKVSRRKGAKNYFKGSADGENNQL